MFRARRVPFRTLQHIDAKTNLKLVAGKTLIHDYIQKDQVLAATQMLDTLRRLGHYPESDVYVHIIRGWLRTANVFKAQETFDKMQKDARPLGPDVFSLLLNGSVRSNQRGQLRKTVDLANQRRLSWSDWLALGAKGGKGEELGPEVEERVRNGLLDPQTLLKVVTEDDAPLDFDHNPAPSSLYAQQLALETRAVERAVSKYQKMMRQVTNAGLGAALKPAQVVLLSWYQPLVRAIKAEQRAVAVRDRKRQEKSKNGAPAQLHEDDEDADPEADGNTLIDDSDRSVGPYLLLLSPQALAVIVMHEMLGMLLRKPAGHLFVGAAMDIGRAVQAEVNIERLRSERSAAFHYLNRSQRAVSVSLVNRLSKQLDEGDWPRPVIAKVGSALIGLALEHCMIHRNVGTYTDDLQSDETEHEQVPAFRHLHRTEAGKRRGYITAHENVYWLIEAGHRLRETLHARHLPMVVQPIDWTDVQTGGYLQSPVSVMRTRGSQQQRDALQNADLTPVYEALSALGKTPWRINQDVYRVAKRAWAAGGGLADLPPREDLPVPSRPSDFNALDWQTQKTHHQSVALSQKINAERHSLRCDTMLKLQVASELLSKTIFMPHNVDFRGRAYPIPPHLNHIGSDLCRGLLWFDEAKPLGEAGLRWLKIHLANVYGHNKLTFDERAQFSEDHIHDIHQSASEPLNPEGRAWPADDPRGWWLQGEEPWQVLATCIELSAALRSASPTAYMSRLPVHQDGTCNGLQHYAALGGDVFGARQVNLEPADRPQDVYAGVAKLVCARVEADAAAGNELAQKLNGHIDRKIVKQTVMTSVYGVTFVGANLQIRARLKEREGLFDSDVEERQASTYLTRLTFDALREMFLGARTIMEWLAACARIIAKSGNPVAWTTPLGLPVVQPYRRPAAVQQVRTLVQTVTLIGDETALPVNVARQTSATAPNFVHSLDSTHMLLTARACQEEGITFASVHDSFWTHAATVPEMAHLLRREFVELHSQPLLHQLRDQWMATNPGVDFPPVPPRGDLDLRNVLKSDFFFS